MKGDSRQRLLVAAALGGVAACTGLPGSGDPHPASSQPADAFAIAQRRCAAQGMEPALAHKEPIRGVRIGGQPLYRGTSIVCDEPDREPSARPRR